MNGAVLTGLVLVVLGGYFLIRAIRSLARAQQSASWPWVEATMARKMGRSNRWDFFANYRYVVAGESYRANRVAFYTLHDEIQVKALNEEIREGETARVHYDPDQPGIATLVTGVARNGKPYSDLIIASLAVAFGALHIVLGTVLAG